MGEPERHKEIKRFPQKSQILAGTDKMARESESPWAALMKRTIAQYSTFCPPETKKKL